MRLAQRRDHLVLAFLREDGLEAQLGDALLAAGLTERRVRPLPAEVGPGSLRVPGAALVVADASGACGKEGVAHGIECLARNEADERAVQVAVSICAFCSLPL